MKKFTKMHGIGNDYVYFDLTHGESIACPEQAAITLSDRHKGVGGDGIILIMNSEKADFRMRMFNNDGSEGKMCGNGTRCIAKYVFDRHLTDKHEFTLETLSGIKKIKIFEENGICSSVSVDMGEPILEASSIPVVWNKDRVIGEKYVLDGKEYNFTCVSMGNPHVVIFIDTFDGLELEAVGSRIEKLDIFPERANVEFIQVLDPHTLKMRVWERGSGETQACGTGACASVVAAVLNGYCKKGDEITVHLLGGDLHITYGERVIMRGGAEFVFDGELEEDV